MDRIAGKGPVVLVVEDEGLLRASAMDMVKEAGFDVLAASDADEAIRVLESRSDNPRGLHGRAYAGFHGRAEVGARHPEPLASRGADSDIGQNECAGKRPADRRTLSTETVPPSTDRKRAERANLVTGLFDRTPKLFDTAHFLSARVNPSVATNLSSSTAETGQDGSYS
jgi:CheY-like chemotaxis protein